MNQSYFTSFADVYNCGAYGAGSFDEGTSCNPSSTTTGSSGNLVDTGANFYVPFVGGVVLIVVALTIIIVSLRKRRVNHKQPLSGEEE